MRRPRLVALIALTGIAVAAPIAYGGDLDDPADSSGTATRGTAVQVADTQPPPSTVAGDSLEIPADSGVGRRVVSSFPDPTHHRHAHRSGNDPRSRRRSLTRPTTDTPTHATDIGRAVP